MVMRTLRQKVGLIVWLSGILLVALLVGLIAPSYMGRNTSGAAAVVDGEPIDQQEYSRDLTARLDQERNDQGGDLTDADTNRVRRETLNALIDDQLAFANAKAVGQVMSEEEFRQDLLNDPSLKDQQGHFDASRYTRILAQMQEQQNLTWQEAEAGFQRSMLLNKVRGFWASQAVLTPAETAAAEARINRQVKAQAAVWNLEKLRAAVTVTDEDLHTYYSENKQQWAKPEQFKLRQILERPDFAASSATAKAKADAVLAKIKAGADFKALASTENTDENARKSGGDLGWVGRDDLRHAELGDAVAGLRKGQTTGVIATSDGFYILKVEDHKEGFEPTFANSKDKALKELGTQRAAKQASLLAHQVLAAVKQGKPFAEAARSAGAELVTTGWFDRDATKALPSLGESPTFARSMLDLSKGDPLPEPVTTDKAVAVAVLSDERPGPAPSKPDLADARARAARQDLRSAKARALYEAWVAQLRAKASIVDQSGILASK